MARPRTRNTIILDEPFKHLSDTYQDQASAMIKELSRKLNLQFIIITHKEALTNYADKIFKVSIKNGKSQVSEQL
jgi:DNA repair exonuclease SbcCD ATPase subunit